MDKRKRLLTGDRPTHDTFPIAAYVGTLKNRLEYQDAYETFVFIADYHALTTHSKNTDEINKNTLGLVRTYLSIGLDPEKVVFYRQSRIPQTFRLHIILSMLTKMPELERQPMLKDKLKAGTPLTYGLMGYPVLMASDILIMKSHVVPVAKDNEAHIEITRDLANRFNSTYEKVFPIPEGIIGDVVVAPSGKGKSGKSTGGIIFTDTSEEVKQKVMSMYTDPKRIHQTDPGKVEGNPVFEYHDGFNDNEEEVKDLKERYKNGTVGDVEVKEKLYAAIEKFLNPIREKKEEVEKRGDDYILRLLEKGEKYAGSVAEKTDEEVVNAIKF